MLKCNRFCRLRTVNNDELILKQIKEILTHALIYNEKVEQFTSKNA